LTLDRRLFRRLFALGVTSLPPADGPSGPCGIMEDQMRKSTNNVMPPVKRPAPAIADRGAVRLGDVNITAEFPPLKRPAPEIADRGTVRLGDVNVTAEFPA
jgi:hypothetical protein